jgi:hypothetical protein
VLLDEAEALDATELRKVARRLLTVVDPEGDQRRDEKTLDRLERVAHLVRHLSITDDHAGGAWIKGRCSTEDAALIKATLIPLAATAAQRRTRLRTRHLHHDGMPPRAPRPRVPRRHPPPDAHHQPPGPGPPVRVATTETGEQLSASAVRQLCCDSEVIPAALDNSSAVLDVGRRQRLATAATWKALVAPDQHCRFPAAPGHRS